MHTIEIKQTRTAIHEVYIDGISIGMGYEADCRELAEELRKDDSVADYILDVLFDEIRMKEAEVTAREAIHA